MRSSRRAGSGVRFHRLDAVAREVEQHLLDHGAVAHHARHGRRQVDLDARAALARLQPHQRQHRLDQQVAAHRLVRLLAPAHEVVHALDDAAGALGLLGDALGRLLAACAAVSASVRGAASGSASRGVAGDRRQRLVELMAQQRGHLADVASRAVACSRSCCWRDSSSMRRWSLTSSTALIQPVCRPAAVDQRRFEDQHRESARRCGAGSRLEALACVCRASPGRARRQTQRLARAYSSASSGGQYGRRRVPTISSALKPTIWQNAGFT
jgi:hypothetical protein